MACVGFEKVFGGQFCLWGGATFPDGGGGKDRMGVGWGGEEIWLLAEKFTKNLRGGAWI